MKMPLDGTSAPTTEEPTAEETAAPELPKFDTAFIVLKRADGAWAVLTDLASPFMAERVVTRSELKQAALEITESIRNQDIASMVAAVLTQNSSEDSQRVSASVRDALAKRREE
jgi:hypothetical protein